MKRTVYIILCAALVALILAGCGEKNDKDVPVFETEGIITVSFKSSVSDWLMVPSDDLPEIIEWLGTFRAGEKAQPPYIPGTNQVRVRIEYSDGTSFENGLSTIRIGDSDYYMTSENAPEAWSELKLFPETSQTEPVAEETAEPVAEDTDPSEKQSEKRWDTPVELVKFSSLEEFNTYIRSAEEDGDVADLASLEFYFLPVGIPEGYNLYKITAGKEDIGFWFLPDEALSSNETAVAAEAQREHFLFISNRGSYQFKSVMEQFSVVKDDLIDGKYIYVEYLNLIIWEQDNVTLMLYLPKDYAISDFDSLCKTERYIKNSNTSEFELSDYGRKVESVCIVSKDDSVTATEFEPTADIEMIAGADLDVLNIRRVDGCPFRIYRGEKELFGPYHAYDAQTLEELDFFHPSGPEPQFFIFSDAAPGRVYILTLLYTDYEKDEETLYAFRAALAEDFPIYPEPPAQEFLSFISPESIEVYVSPVFEKLYPTDTADDPLTLEDYLCYICGPDAWEFHYNGPGLDNYPEAVIEVHDSDGRTLSIMSDAPALLIVESDGSLTWAWHADGDIDCADLILRLLPWARGEYTGLG